MKLTFSVMIFGLLQVSAAGYAQKVSLSLKNASLIDVLSNIKQQTGYNFLYNSEMLSKSQSIDIEVKNEQLTTVLDKCFKNQPLTFLIEEKTVIIKEKNKPAQIAAVNIKGKVTDEKGEPLSGASIKVKGTNNSVSSDINGEFTLKNVEPDAVLVVSFLSFVTQEISVGNTRTFNIQLKASSSNLDELVVIGYGSVKRRDLTGSVGSVKIEEMQKAPVRSFEEALAGRVAGVQVTSVDGQPGSDINITVRGANSITGTNAPLYVIDGFPIENPDNNGINPDDIESIEVLKDASATAIYGARGSNGVIIITTKTGKEGATTISYNGYYGTQEVIQQMDLFDSYEFVKYQVERQASTASLYFNADRPDLESYRSVQAANWQDRLFRTAPMQNHSLSILGGTKGTKYSISGNILDQDGVLTSSGYKRYQGRIRLDQKISDNFTVSGNVNYSTLKKSGGTPIPESGAFQSSALMYSVWGYRPVTGNPNFDLEDDGVDPDIDVVNDLRFNPIQNYENQLREQTTNVLTANGYGEYKWNDFKLRISGGVTRSMRRSDAFDNSNTRSGSPSTPQGLANGVNGSAAFLETNNYLNENTLTYDKKFNGGHNLSVVTGFTFQGRNSNGFGAYATFVPNELLGVSGLDEGVPNRITSTSTSATSASFLARANYNYKSKYLATASYRADGSSRFAPGNHVAYFPSGAVSWRISEERFMKSFKFISEAKIRAGIGATGNNRVSDFGYTSTLNLPNSAVYAFNNAAVRGLLTTALGNDKLRWETTFQTNVGLDLSMLDNRAILTADVYRKTTDDLLLNAPLPPSLGFERTFKNIGKVRNDGLEISLETINFKGPKFTWSTNFNIAFNRNKVLALTENQQAMVSFINWETGYRNLPAFMAKIGQPIGMFYGLLWEGNYQFDDFTKLPSGQYLLKPEVATNGNAREDIRPGDIKYSDLNGDGIANLSDYTIIGDPNPDFIGGLSNNFAYKGFDLNVFLQWSYGNDIMNTNRLVFEGAGRSGQNMFASYLNRWTPENQNNEYYRTGGAGTPAYSSRIVEDGSFLRLKTISLGYQFPAKLLKQIKVKGLRLYASAQNIHTWTNYQGYDPEVSAYDSALTPGFDWSVYPRAKTITFGLNITL
jgi:TonB-linked SusC/RagA family outer membrane protein